MIKVKKWNIITIGTYSACCLRDWNVKNLTNFSKYNTLADEEVVLLAQNGDMAAMEYILIKYTGFVKLRSNPYFMAGAEKDDLVQEGLIGLYSAVKSFDKEKKANFKTFAELCVVRQMITAVKTSTRKKNSPLNHYVSINGADDEPSQEKLMLSFEDLKNINPESIMIEKESLKGMESTIEKLLSDFENKVLSLFLNGETYREIADSLGKTPKAVDNALCRIKKKIEKHLND